MRPRGRTIRRRARRRSAPPRAGRACCRCRGPGTRGESPPRRCTPRPAAARQRTNVDRRIGHKPRPRAKCPPPPRIALQLTSCLFLAQHGVDRKRRRGTITSTNFAAPSHAARAGDDAGRAGLENPAVFGGDPAEHEYGDQRVRRGLQPAACTEPAGRAAGAANARCPGPAADVARGGWAPPRCRVLWFFSARAHAVLQVLIHFLSLFCSRPLLGVVFPRSRPSICGR